MYEELFRDVGLSPNESRVYEALLKIGESSVQSISLESSVHKKNFKPANPQKLLSLLKEKEEKVNNFMPEMQARYQAIDEKEEAYIYKGIEGVKNYLNLILKTKETVYFIGAKAMWLDPRLKHFLPHFQRERKKLGIKFKHIFDQEVKKEMPDILKFVGKPYKFLPKDYSSPTMVDIFGPYVVTFIGVQPGQLPDEPIQFVMKSQKLADGYRKFFQFMWDSCN